MMLASVDIGGIKSSINKVPKVLVVFVLKFGVFTRPSLWIRVTGTPAINLVVEDKYTTSPGFERIQPS